MQIYTNIAYLLLTKENDMIYKHVNNVNLVICNSFIFMFELLISDFLVRAF